MRLSTDGMVEKGEDIPNEEEPLRPLSPDLLRSLYGRNARMRVLLRLDLFYRLRVEGGHGAEDGSALVQGRERRAGPIVVVWRVRVVRENAETRLGVSSGARGRVCGSGLGRRTWAGRLREAAVAPARHLEDNVWKERRGRTVGMRGRITGLEGA